MPNAFIFTIAGNRKRVNKRIIKNDENLSVFISAILKICRNKIEEIVKTQRE